MTDLRISDIAGETGLSKRYWQRLAMAGGLPGASFVQFGERRTYFVDADTFRDWWNAQKKAIPCRATSANAVKSGGTGSQKTASRMKDRWKPKTSDLLKAALKASSGS